VTYTSTSFLLGASSALSSPVSALACARDD
jgi:hypothetical protein